MPDDRIIILALKLLEDSNRGHELKVEALTILIDLANFSCCCPTHRWDGCPDMDCDGCPDCLAGRARRVITELDDA